MDLECGSYSSMNFKYMSRRCLDWHD